MKRKNVNKSAEGRSSVLMSVSECLKIWRGKGMKSLRLNFKESLKRRFELKMKPILQGKEKVFKSSKH